MHMHVFATVNSAWCSRVEVGRVCVRLWGECWGVVREAVERKVDGKWGVGGFADEVCMWSFRTVEREREIPLILVQHADRQ